MVSSDDAQRLFLQAILSRGILTGKLAQILWEKCIAAVTAADPDLTIPHSNSKDAWDAFVVKVNRSIDSLDLEFRHLHDETTGKEMYAIVNRKGDEIAQMATDYTPAEIAYFKAIIDLIMLAPNESFSVSSFTALREASSIKPVMSKSQSEVVLGSFVAKGWLLRSKRGRYSLSTRSLLELLPYLKSTYPDEIIECTICMEVMTRGIACHTNNCKTRMHYHCFATFRRRHNGCPSCRTEWPETAHENPLVPVGEGAAKDGENTKRPARARGSVGNEDEEDEEDEEEGDLLDEGSQSQPTRQRSQRTKKGKAPVDENMEIDEDEEEKPAAAKKEKKTSTSNATRRSSRK